MPANLAVFDSPWGWGGGSESYMWSVLPSVFPWWPVLGTRCLYIEEIWASPGCQGEGVPVGGILSPALGDS